MTDTQLVIVLVGVLSLGVALIGHLVVEARRAESRHRRECTCTRKNGTVTRFDPDCPLHDAP